jgi:hypothetical protein
LDARTPDDQLLAERRVLGDELRPCAHQVRGRAENSELVVAGRRPVQRLSSDSVDRRGVEAPDTFEQAGTCRASSSDARMGALQIGAEPVVECSARPDVARPPTMVTEPAGATPPNSPHSQHRSYG